MNAGDKLNSAAQILAQLGIPRAHILETVRLRFGDDETGLGRGRGAVELGLAALLTSQAFVDVTVPALGDVGLRIERSTEDSAVLRVTDVLERGITVSMGPTQREGWVASESGTTAVVNLHVGSAAALVGDEGALLDASGEDLAVTPFLTSRLVVEPLAAIEPDVELWATTTEDPWLAGEVARRMRRGAPWHRAVAAGLCARHATENRSVVADRLADLIAGRATDPARMPRQWARRLTDAQLRTLEDLSLVQIDRLYRYIGQLRTDERDAVWIDDFGRLCGGRDDLACVRVLLAEGSASAALDEALHELDAEATALVGELAGDLELEDEQLRRASLSDPASWWTRPAAGVINLED